MRKGFIFAGILITIILSYLFYHSCKRDTFVIAPLHRLAIPDSSWIHGTIDLKQIKKDIAWSTLLNGDFNKIFQTDTNTNTLIKILRSAENYSIIEQQNIRYFSVLKDSINYVGLLLSLEKNTALKKSFKSDSFTLNHKTVYSFRSDEGIWLYNSSNLLFVSGKSDSLAACSFFASTDTLHTPVSLDNNTIDTFDISSDEVLISGHINTRFVPVALKHPLLDSALFSFNVLSNDDILDIQCNYKGFLTETLNQSSISHQNNEAAFFCAANLNNAGIKHILSKISSLQQSYSEQQTTLDTFLSAIDKNNLTIEFDGWKKIKSSYYASVMNDEFEMVLQKRDSSIIEPIFKITLEQKNKTAALNFLTYLQKEGLVSKGKQQPFAIIYGNFDSELKLQENNTFILHNKHTPEWARITGPAPLDAALLVQINPASLKGLSDSNLETHPFFSKFNIQKEVSYTVIHLQKEHDVLRGNIKMKFTDKNHPFISLMKMLKK